MRFKKRRASDRSSKESSRFLSVAKRVFIILLVSLGIFVFVKLNTRYWNGKDKLGFVYQAGNGDVGVVVADPVASELTTLIIPGETEVEIARNYGSLRIKNVWQLSLNEKLEGKLLPETVMQNFLFPVFLWSSEAGGAIGEGRLENIASFVISGQTNIPLGDRLNLGLFALKVATLGKNEIDLGQSQFLQKQVLKDGVSGYRAVGTISERLTVYFSDDEMIKENVKVYIIDETGETGVAEKTGQIMEVLGGKVVSIDKRAPQKYDCQVSAKNKNIGAKISRFLACRVVSGDTDFDVEIKLGQDFAKRF